MDSGTKLLAVDVGWQLLPGTFEHALSHLLDHELDLSHVDAHYRNDAAGAKAHAPAVLLKVVQCAYSQGILSSRAIERACREHVTFMALSGDSAPHVMTIANVVSGREQQIAQVSAAVLAICQRQGLIGQEMFAIDAVKLPGNASKARSGTRADLMRRKIDSPDGRRAYGRGLGIVEPVFANIRHNKRLNRFALRGRRKVDTQWKLYCLVHNIEKLMRYGTIGQAA